MPSLADLLGMVMRTLQSPREGAHEVLAIGVPREAIWIIIAIVVVISAFMGQLVGLLAGGDQTLGGIFGSPLVSGILQLLAILLTIGAVYGIGRAMGGTGSLVDAAILVSWLQFVMICVQVVQVVALVIVPPLAGLIFLAALGLFLWILTEFVAVLHEFKSRAQVFIMIVVSAFTIAFLASIVLTILGLGIPVPAGEA